MNIFNSKLYKLILFPIFIFTLNSFAEYRVFNLVITSKSANPEEPAQVRTTLSTLDPLQYKYYYQLLPNETVSYTETWMCKGRTDHQNYCPNPKVPPVDETEASAN